MKRCIVLVGVTLIPGSLWAQSTLHSWSALHLPPESTVYVLDDTGQETTGKVLRLDADSLVLLVDGGTDRRFEAARVKRLAKRGDSLRNGAYIGAAIGAALGVFADCHYKHELCGAGRKMAFVASAAGLYAGIGIGVDRLHQGRTALYEAPEARSGSLLQQRSASRRSFDDVTVNLAFRW